MPAGALMHGWPGLLGAYAAVQAPLLAAMVRARAPWRRLLLAPVIAAPVTAASGAALALLTPALAGFGIASASLAQLSVGVAVSAGLGYLAGRALGGGALQSAHLRGAMVVAADTSARRGARDTQRGAARAHGTLTLAGVALSAEDETKHFKLIGTTGTGKSTAIRELLGAALARGDRAVIADPDGGYLRQFYDRARGDIVLNPFEPASVRWDLFGELAEAHDVEQLARALIPDHEGPDRSWRGYARTFFSAVTDQARAGGVTDVRELYRLLVVAGTAELRTLVAGTPAQPFLEEHNGRMFDSIRSVTSSAVSALSYVARQGEGAPFSVRRWTAEAGRAAGRGVLFIPYRAGEIAALRSIVSAWMRLSIFEAMNAPEGGQRLWFVVDELDALGQIDGLKDALARLRKFGGRCVLGFQSVAQVSATYGAGEAQTIVENCGATLILRCAGSEHGGTSQFASRLIGEREVLRGSTSRSRRPFELLPVTSRSESPTVEAAVMASEIEQLPDLAGYLKLASRREWLRVSLAHPAAAYTPQPPRAPPARLIERSHEDFGME
ncbi:MAG: type IV secretion system DNA-binding domain-containing protein [Gammaproteobacteria bacterium]|nr:type IV secretion system DNA-binding domain-containing protein [Gammaproteobacteria bacterium]